ncbi:Phosphatidylinositol (PI) 3-kinase [Boothiomyces macroporosus]|uniref:Phosphatidylinositol 3-kinase VPS34 n=1 Tax=Boothiomyces macroporosus TaxID=261099 RepID=A0AAD5Y8F6_9FUNG|nr:Phosphatidylinositol (PI) 3-kinase [Boothiomyces macroporosus]
MQETDFSYCLTSELSLNLKFKIIDLKVYDAYKPRQGIQVAFIDFNLFGDNKTLKKELHRLVLQTDFQIPKTTVDEKEVKRFDHLMRKYNQGDIQRAWLDNYTLPKIKEYQNQYTKPSLFIYLPVFDFPIVYNEKEYTNVSLRDLDSPLVCFDFEFDNPIESKHRKLNRSHRTNLDKELKPNAKQRDELNKILRYPPTQTLMDDEKDLVWKFRYYLTKDKKALTKFLKCVIWSDAIETKLAVDILSSWVSVDIEDALELLSPAFTNKNVRSFAVSQLERTSDDELQMYLLQLVQALKFEHSESPLTAFLIERSVLNSVLGNYFHWYLMVECEDKVYGRMFAKVAYQFLSKLIQTPDGVNKRDNLRRQGELISSLTQLSKELRASKEPRPKKVEKLRSFISDPRNGLLSFPPISLPLDPSIQITGLIPEKSNMFKSALLPFYLTFTCLDGQEYPIMFKTGDDLRQDQLVVQIFSLMDRLLRKENLDLKLMPYKVLATGIDNGMIQFVPSKAIASILSENNNSLIPYLSDSLSNVIEKPTMDSGYCVMTYLLGIGDRHLDNLLLTHSGNLFHIDFGFILGRDPKPFPPPMKICKEMVDVMGGANSNNYQTFKSFSFIAFNSLRKNANLILNLFSLMVDANIPDISIEPDKTVSKVQERFRLDLSDEEGIQYFNGLINESIGAYFPQVMEQLHKVVQLFRS